MPTNTNVTNLKINELTKAQFETAVQGGVIGANELSLITDMSDTVQVETMPTASVDELGNIYQFVGTTDANYTNGYFYKCVSDGQQPATYSWSNIQVQASSGGLPTQTGNAGKFLTTDGTDASWAEALTNKTTQTDALSIGVSSGNARYSLVVAPSSTTNSFPDSVVGLGAGIGAGMYADNSVVIGRVASVGGTQSIAIGRSAQASNKYNVAIGGAAKTGANGAIQLGHGTNNTAGTLSVGSTTDGTNFNNYELLSADGTVPADRLIHAINKYSTMPTAASTNLGWIVQFTGTTDSTYTHGHLYECVSDGQDPATYSWTEVQLGGGGSSYTAGTGIDITSGVISVTSPTLQNTATGTDSLTISGTASVYNYGINIGFGSTCGGDAVVIGYNANGDTNGIAIGKNVDNKSYGGAVVIGSGSTASIGFNYGIAIGAEAKITANNCIQLNASGSTKTNSDANTFKVGNANGNYEMMSADGTIPTARLTKVNSTITLTSAGWSSNTQTVNVTGMTATGVVLVSPDPTYQADYTSAGIYCTAQAAGTLTFTCSSVPSADIDVNVVML